MCNSNDNACLWNGYTNTIINYCYGYISSLTKRKIK